MGKLVAGNPRRSAGASRSVEPHGRVRDVQLYRSQPTVAEGIDRPTDSYRDLQLPPACTAASAQSASRHTERCIQALHDRLQHTDGGLFARLFPGHHDRARLGLRLWRWLRALTGDKVVELYTNSCPSPVWESTLFVWAAKSFYYSKYVEYLDTAWLVLKGKPVSFLQTFHHFGAPWDVYLGLALKNEGLWIFMFLNAFIHTLMYTYYGLTAAGYRIPFKPLMTLMQLFQFCCGFTIVWQYINIPCFRRDQGMLFSWVFNYFYVGLVLLLFMHFFYLDNFRKGQKMSASTKKA